MGYDMYHVTQDPADVAAHEAARVEFYRLAHVRDALPKNARGGFEWDTGQPSGGTEEWQTAQRAVNDAAEAMYAAERFYFRLNIWGMSAVREAMLDTGMAFDVNGPDWPNDPSEEDVERILRSHQGETPGIPIYKFCSNDGWVVTPSECEAALRAWDVWTEAHPDAKLPENLAASEDPDGWAEIWTGWLDYLRRAVDADGFEVN